MRQTPKYPYPGPTALGFPRFDPQVPGIVPAPAAANPVIAFRYGQWIGNAIEPLFVRPQYHRFPYFQQEVPANPLVAFRYGQSVLADPTAPIPARYLAYPYFQETPVAANPVIAFRYGRPLLDDPTVPVPARHLPYPYFQGPIAPANPVIAYLRGQWFGDATQPLASLPRYFPFPYVSAAPAPSANPVIAYRMNRWVWGEVQPIIESQRFPVFPFLIPAQVAFRYGRDVLQIDPGFVPARHLAFPYWQAPAPANAVIPISLRRLAELTGFAPGMIFSAPHYYPLVLLSPIPPAAIAFPASRAVTQELNQARRHGLGTPKRHGLGTPKRRPS